MTIQTKSLPPLSSVPAAALRVERSVLGEMWEMTPYDARLAEGISQSFGLPEIVGRLLSARGITFDQVDTFLNPAIKT